ncbi:hypothetical protein [Psittacicella hinzii]|nr:hypothetical protein [Psittacicella hinzii]
MSHHHAGLFTLPQTEGCNCGKCHDHANPYAFLVNPQLKAQIAQQEYRALDKHELQALAQNTTLASYGVAKCLGILHAYIASNKPELAALQDNQLGNSINTIVQTIINTKVGKWYEEFALNVQFSPILNLVASLEQPNLVSISQALKDYLDGYKTIVSLLPANVALTPAIVQQLNVYLANLEQLTVNSELLSSNLLEVQQELANSSPTLVKHFLSGTYEPDHINTLTSQQTLQELYLAIKELALFAHGITHETELLNNYYLQALDNCFTLTLNLSMQHAVIKND